VLAFLRRARELWAERYPERGPLLTKSGIVAGMGETDDEIIETMRDLRDHDVDVVTIGQYLQPSPRHLPLDRWVPLESFRRFREEGDAMGFGSVFSGPLVRSSYRADEQQLAARGESRVVTL
jgi:lipoyl synthase